MAERQSRETTARTAAGTPLKARPARALSLLHLLTAGAIALGLVMVFLVAPREATMGDVQRIFYFHVAASWTGYLALAITFIAGLLYLRKGGRRWDQMSWASAEIGLLFITEGIITGSLWAKPVWGTWWTWDPRLTTSAVLWLVYAAYLLLRHSIEEEARRARFSAVYSILAFVAVPLNFMAIRWWRAMHPLVLNSSGFGMTPTMLITLIISVVAFTLLYVTMLSLRLRVARAEEALRQLRLQQEGLT